MTLIVVSEVALFPISPLRNVFFYYISTYLLYKKELHHP